jgi:hypothetical protein
MRRVRVTLGLTSKIRYLAGAIQPARLDERAEVRAEGRQEGFQQGERAVLLRQLRQRFGNEVDQHVERRVSTASIDQLETWVGRVFSAATLAELFAD